MVARTDWYTRLADLLIKEEIDIFTSTWPAPQDRNFFGRLYRRWIKPLQDLNITFQFSAFMKAVTSPAYDRTYTAIGGIDFYKSLYPDFDYTAIHAHALRNIMSKRGSPYDVDNIMKKKGVSQEGAQKISEERKENTKITLENLVKKHGPEKGQQVYDNFVAKSMSTKENYQKRYGDKWEEKWNFYIKSRDSRSLKYNIEKYGEIEGRARQAKSNKQFAEKHSLSYLQKTHGEKEGKQVYLERMSKRDSSSLEHCIGISASHEAGVAMYNEKNKLKSRVYCAMKEYWQGQGLEDMYEKYHKKEIESPVVFAPREWKRARGPVSQQSIKFFKLLEEKLNRPLQYGKKGAELKLFDPIDLKLFYYDCFDVKTNTIIEFNGIAFHGDPRSRTVLFDVGLHFDDLEKRDAVKKKYAIDQGYKFIVIWDYEVSRKHERQAKLNELVGILNED